MSKKREWIVNGKVEFSGATAFVMASSEQEALAKASRLELSDGVDIGCAEMINWDFTKAEPND